MKVYIPSLGLLKMALQGRGSTDDPSPVTYGTDAEGKENVVTFTSHRTDEDGNTCVTSNKRTCAVNVGAIKRAIAPAPGGSETFELITDENKKVLPGQKIILKCEVPTLSVQEYEWSLPGKTFKDYTANQTTATLTELAAGDKNQQVSRFYWADSGDGRVVKCKVKINNKWYEIKNTLDVAQPTSSITTTLGASGMRSITGVGSYIGLHATPSSEEGVVFKGKITVPTGLGQGTWHFVQLITLQRFRTKDDGSKEKMAGNGTSYLDTTYPYEPAPFTQHPGSAGSYSTTEEYENYDTPEALLLPTMKHHSIRNESFETYLMFLPNGDDSRYVPLKKFTWSYSVSATKDASGNWTVDAGTPAQNVGTPSATTSHPTWTDNMKNYKNFVPDTGP